MQLQVSLKALRVAAPYIRAFRGRLFVVKLGGQLCTPGRVLTHVVEQLALLHHVGIKLVVVHGGGPQANALSERMGARPDIFAGRRITDDATLDVVRMAFAGTVNTDVTAAFRAAEVDAVGLSGIDAKLLTAKRRPPQSVTDPSTKQTREVDYGHVGDIVEVRTDVLQTLLDKNCVPVICSLAADKDGQILNVNADTIAARIAIATGAAKYMLVSTVDGVLGDHKDPSTLQSYLDIAELDGLIESGVIGSGMLPKLAACREAVLAGVPRVHIVNGTTTDAILGEIFTNEGSGTLIVKQRNDTAAVPKPQTVPA